MPKRTTSVDELYSEGRHYPRGQNRDPQPRQRIPHEPPLETGNSRGAFNRNTNQDPENKHDAGYLNDCEGWVRGAPTGKAPSGNNETAEDYPQGNFDKGSSWRLKDKATTGIRRPAPTRLNS
jgi:hypothetical protein